MEMSKTLISALALALLWLCGPSCAAAPVNNPSGAVRMTEHSPLPSYRTGLRPTANNEPRLSAETGLLPVDTTAGQQEKVANGDDEQSDTTAFGDLPKIEISEDELKGRQIVGHDHLIESELRRLLSEFGEDSHEVPEIFLNEVKLYIRAYQQNPQYRKFITNSLKRSTRYMTGVRKIFASRNIPEDMAYIAFVESGFNPYAKSRAGALGMWQFMPGTARDYSLRVAKGVDERLDPARSTYAACEYFHDLIAIFGPRSFLLALAAYNSGEGKIISCLKRIDNPIQQRTFWHIRPCLAPESREYPPRIIAAAVIGNNPEIFGFPRYDATGQEIEFSRAPEMEAAKRQIQPLHLTTQTVQERTKTKGRPSRTSVAEPPRTKLARRSAPKAFTYLVRKGNTLDGVAEAFHVSREDIKRWNGLKNNHLLAGARLKIFPSAPMETVRYTVRRGDTVRDISQSFGLRPVRIIVCNGLQDGVVIRPGETLVLYKEVKNKPTIYRVKKGSNLTRIAEVFDVRAKDIMRWNNLDSPSVFPNQKLRIYKDLKGV